VAVFPKVSKISRVCTRKTEVSKISQFFLLRKATHFYGEKKIHRSTTHHITEAPCVFSLVDLMISWQEQIVLKKSTTKQIFEPSIIQSISQSKHFIEAESANCEAFDPNQEA
jgi:hypothetical protein